METLWISDSKGWHGSRRTNPVQPRRPRHRGGTGSGLDLKGLGMVVWSPLAGGYLREVSAGSTHLPVRVRPRTGLSRPRSSIRARSDSGRAARCRAARSDRSPAQVALRWALEQPLVASAIIGARTAEQLGDTLAAAGWELPQEAVSGSTRSRPCRAAIRGRWKRRWPNGANRRYGWRIRRDRLNRPIRRRRRAVPVLH